MADFTVNVYNHVAATGVHKSVHCFSFRSAQRVARELAQEDFMEKTIITSWKTGKQWEQWWPRFSPATLAN